MRANHLSREDLLEEMRQHGQAESPEEVKPPKSSEATISVIPFTQDA